jgi:hypothetical protein
MNEINRIMMPLLTYRFRVLLDDAVDSEMIFTKNIVNIVIDYKNRKLRVTVRQPEADANMTQIINYLCQTASFSLRIESLAENAKAISTNDYLWCKTESHRFELAYGISDAAIHELEITFKDIKTIKGE